MTDWIEKYISYVAKGTAARKAPMLARYLNLKNDDMQLIKNNAPKNDCVETACRWYKAALNASKSDEQFVFNLQSSLVCVNAVRLIKEIKSHDVFGAHVTDIMNNEQFYIEELVICVEDLVEKKIKVLAAENEDLKLQIIDRENTIADLNIKSLAK